MVLKKNKKSTVKPFMVKNHVSIFVNSLIENPAFDSQVRACHVPMYKAWQSSCPAPCRQELRLKLVLELYRTEQPALNWSLYPKPYSRRP